MPHDCGGSAQGDSSAGVPHRPAATLLPDGGEEYENIVTGGVFIFIGFGFVVSRLG